MNAASVALWIGRLVKAKSWNPVCGGLCDAAFVLTVYLTSFFYAQENPYWKKAKKKEGIFGCNIKTAILDYFITHPTQMHHDKKLDI